MNYAIYGCIAVCLLVMTLNATSQPDDAPLMVNMMVTPDMPAMFDENDSANLKTELRAIYHLVAQKNQTLTLFLTQDASKEVRALLGQIGLYSGFEYGISGKNSAEELSSKSYLEQKNLLDESIRRAESCAICGRNEISIKGFMPTSFDQNEDTYKALEASRIEYDAGFQAGVIYAPGHEKDIWPYKIDGYSVYAVPISTIMLSGERVPLDDKYAAEKGLTSSQWYDLLVAKLDEAALNDEPVVISISTSVSGSREYLDALDKFIDYAISKNARFVTSYELVKVSQTGVFTEVNLSKTGCTTCNQESDSNKAIIKQSEAPSNITANMY